MTGIEGPGRCADILPLLVLAVYAVENLNIIQFDLSLFLGGGKWKKIRFV
jgi:hypothetical protein